MSERWATKDPIHLGGVFDHLHSGLTVSLIQTPRKNISDCSIDEKIEKVLERAPQEYDYLPVVGTADGDGRYVGILSASELRKRDDSGTVSGSYLPLGESWIIGADASIKDFIVSADRQPFRLVVAGTQVTGIVALSDMQRLPVRAALFALITGFEMAMAEKIKVIFPSSEDWKQRLSDRRQTKIQEEIRKFSPDESTGDELLFTQFCDKREILKGMIRDLSDTDWVSKLEKIEKLRNKLAHANEYASSRGSAKEVCATVRDLLCLLDKVAIANKGAA